MHLKGPWRETQGEGRKRGQRGLSAAEKPGRRAREGRQGGLPWASSQDPPFAGGEAEVQGDKDGRFRP